MSGVLDVMLVAGSWGAELPATIFTRDDEIGTGAQTSLTFNAAGDWQSVGNTMSPSGTWKLVGSGADFDIYFELLTGVVDSGSATDTWLNLGTNRSWVVGDSLDIGEDEVTANLIIRDTATEAVLATASVSMVAFAEP